jgi:hypothetical protein
MPAIGFTDFDPPAVDGLEPAAPPDAGRAPRARRDDFYDTPIVDGKPAPNTPLSRLRDIMRALESATHSLRGGSDTVPDRAICTYFRGDRLTPKRSGTLQIKLGPARIRPLGARWRARGVS